MLKSVKCRMRNPDLLGFFHCCVLLSLLTARLSISVELPFDEGKLRLDDDGLFRLKDVCTHPVFDEHGQALALPKSQQKLESCQRLRTYLYGSQGCGVDTATTQVWLLTQEALDAYIEFIYH